MLGGHKGQRIVQIAEAEKEAKIGRKGTRVLGLGTEMLKNSYNSKSGQLSTPWNAYLEPQPASLRGFAFAY